MDDLERHRQITRMELWVEIVSKLKNTGYPNTFCVREAHAVVKAFDKKFPPGEKR